ncbi:MAG: polyprenol monophosphomannose synthase [Candidatus Margulisbacteria bacterium]|nr:polyprenol monophosphomannose synthase [Candidatus Margulisiibacteriota bacterium]
MSKTYVIIPTYNEAENIEALIKEILGLNIFGLTILVVDDNSPDNTGKIAEKIGEEDPRVKTIIRYKNRGRGSAGIEGFKFALREGADYTIEMDADFSHHPRYIPDLLKYAKDYDVVLGSRFVKEGKDADRSFIRKITTLFARTYIRLILGIKVKDITSGFRCFKRRVLEGIDLDNMISTGPSIVSEILYKAKLKNFTIYEIPIIFEDRKKGQTKLNLIILLKTLYMVFIFRMRA